MSEIPKYLRPAAPLMVADWPQQQILRPLTKKELSKWLGASERFLELEVAAGRVAKGHDGITPDPVLAQGRQRLARARGIGRQSQRAKEISTGAGQMSEDTQERDARVELWAMRLMK